MFNGFKIHKLLFKVRRDVVLEEGLVLTKANGQKKQQMIILRANE